MKRSPGSCENRLREKGFPTNNATRVLAWQLLVAAASGPRPQRRNPCRPKAIASPSGNLAVSGAEETNIHLMDKSLLKRQGGKELCAARTAIKIPRTAAVFSTRIRLFLAKLTRCHHIPCA